MWLAHSVCQLLAVVTCMVFCQSIFIQKFVCYCVNFRKNIKLFLKSENLMEDGAHPLIAHCTEVFKSGIRKADLRFVDCLAHNK